MAIAVLSTGDPVLTIGDMVRAQGVTRFSQKAGGVVTTFTQRLTGN